MKIAVAQLRPFKGDVPKNIEKHRSLISLAVDRGADLIVFPELSVTGYEPALADRLAMNAGDKALETFREISDLGNVTICVGVPLRVASGVEIGMVIFQPLKPPFTYSKRYLHSDELPYFTNGGRQEFLQHQAIKIAPAICYESLLEEHAKEAAAHGAGVYLASVAKSARGLAKAFLHYPEIAGRYSMFVVMSNSTGPSDNFVSAGQSSVWNREGKLLCRMGEHEEGIIVLDTDNENVGSFVVSKESSGSVKMIRTDSGDASFLELVKLLDEELRGNYTDSHSFYSQYNKINDRGHVIVAYEGETPVGCGAIRQYSPSAAEIKRMYVRPRYRRKGIGTTILAGLEQWAKELKCKSCLLETGFRQTEAINVYSKSGYSVIPNYGQYNGISSSICMEKHLTGI
jgi:predicted amidohydrolase/GNAT superfamily N-acetyltransferase